MIHYFYQIPELNQLITCLVPDEYRLILRCVNDGFHKWVPPIESRRRRAYVHRLIRGFDKHADPYTVAWLILMTKTNTFRCYNSRPSMGAALALVASGGRGGAEINDALDMAAARGDYKWWSRAIKIVSMPPHRSSAVMMETLYKQAVLWPHNMEYLITLIDYIGTHGHLLMDNDGVAEITLWLRQQVREAPLHVKVAAARALAIMS